MRISASSNLIVLPIECKKLIFLSALFQGGRLCVGAISLLYFLSFGLRPEDYASIKAVQAIVFVVLDIPIGYLLNRIGEYKSLILSIVLGATGALGYLLFSSFWGFLFSEAFLALSLSTWPVALSAYSMRVLEDYETKGLVEKFFHCGDAVSNLAIVVCGCLGGFVYAFNKHIPYTFFVFFYLFAILFASIYLKSFQKTENKKIFKKFICNGKELKSVLPFASVLLLIQFFMQPIFHYWQPLFGERFFVISKDLSIIFVGYSIITSAISWIYSRMTHIPFLRSSLFVVISSIVGSIIFVLIVSSNYFNLSLVFFSFAFGIFNLSQISCGVLLQNKLKKENRAIITKYVSFYSRVGMIVSLVLLHWLFANEWKIERIYKLYGVLSISIFCLYLGWIVIQRKWEKKYVIDSSN